MLQVEGKAHFPNPTVETQAKAVAYVVCRGVELETNFGADYTHLYNGDKKMLTESLAAIQATSSKILDHLRPQQDRSPFQESLAKGTRMFSLLQQSGVPGDLVKE